MEPNGKLLVDRRGRVLLLMLSNPRFRNALSPEMYRTGAEALRTAAEDPGIGAIILTGEGNQFCSGGNLKRLAENRAKPREVTHESITGLHAWVLALRQCPKPVIAAVEGSAAGAGFSLALACDLIVAARDARLGMAYVKVGLSPDGGASASLARALPRQCIAEILFEGNAMTAERLHALGVVNQLCDSGESLHRALDWAQRLASGPPAAMARIKRLIDSAYVNDIAAQLDLERELFAEGLFHEECGEGIAAFLEKRAPRFTQPL